MAVEVDLDGLVEKVAEAVSAVGLLFVAQVEG